MIEAHYIGVDVLEGTWKRIPVPEIRYALENNLNVLLYDTSTQYAELLAGFVIESYVQDSTPEYPYVHIPITEHKLILDPYTLELLKRFHYSWFNALKGYLYTEEFKGILYQIKQLRRSVTVYPSSTDMFRVFLFPIGAVQCTWIGLSPYQSNQACGIAFAVEQGAAPPSLQVLEQGIRDDSGLSLPATFSLDKQLLPLRASGVFLLNAAFTCTATDPTAHVELWSPLLMRVIQILNHLDKPWVLWGKVAGSYSKYITAGTVHKLPHPSWYARTNTKLETDVFSQLRNSNGICYN